MYVSFDLSTHVYMRKTALRYGVATISRLLKIIGLLRKRALQQRLYSAKQTCNFKEPTNGCHPIVSTGFFFRFLFVHKRLVWHVNNRFLFVHICLFWHVWHDSFVCVTWLILMRDMPHSYVWPDSFICVTWLIHMCDMTHSYAWHDSLRFVT